MSGRRVVLPSADPLVDESWKEQGSCVGDEHPDDWFPHESSGPPVDRSRARLRPETVRALTLCNLCPVRPRCLAYALKHRERNGIWGGTLESERERLRRRIRSRAMAS